MAGAGIGSSSSSQQGSAEKAGERPSPAARIERLPALVGLWTFALAVSWIVSFP